MKTFARNLLSGEIISIVRRAVATEVVQGVERDGGCPINRAARKKKAGGLAALLLLAMGSAAAATTAATTPALMPGLYRLVPPQPQSQLQPSPPVERKSGAPEPELEYVPSRDGVRFAVLSVDPQGTGVKLLLLSDRAIKKHVHAPDGNKDPAGIEFNPSSGQACHAFSGQTSESNKSEVRSGIGDANFCRFLDGETALRADGEGFTLSGQYTRTGPYGYSPTRYGKVISHFERVKSEPYSDIAVMGQAAQLRSAPDVNAPAVQTLANATYVPVRETLPEWQQVDVVAADGTARQGWLQRSELVVSPWVDQLQRTALYRFQIAAKESDGDTAWEAIKVIDRKTGEATHIFDAGFGHLGAPASLLDVVDANFDGYPDISVSAADGGAGPNNSSNFYLFNPQTKRFEFDASLSELSQPDIDAKHRTVVSGWRASCCDHGVSYYRWIDKRLVKVREEERVLRPGERGDRMEVIQGRLVGGKWKTTSRYEAVPQ